MTARKRPTEAQLRKLKNDFDLAQFNARTIVELVSSLGESWKDLDVSLRRRIERLVQFAWLELAEIESELEAEDES